MKSKIIKILTFVILVIFLVSGISYSQNWQWLGPDSVRIDHMYIKGDTLYVGTPYHLYYSDDRGSTWEIVDSALGEGQIVSLSYDVQNGRRLYFVKGRGPNFLAGLLYLYDQTDRSITLISDTANNIMTSVKNIAVSPHDSDLMLGIQLAGHMGQIDDLYRSENGGTSWEFVGGQFPVSSHGVEVFLIFDPEDPSTVHAIANTQFDQLYYRSTDSGKQWNYISDVLSFRLGFTKEDGQWVLFNYHSWLYRSYDLGLNWDGPYEGLSFRRIHNISKSPHILYATAFSHETRQNGIYVSTDSGKSWEMLNGTDNIGIQSGSILFIDEESGNMYLGKSDGLHRYSTPVSVNDIKKLPQRFILHQNYPNPFNPETRISYELPDMSFVSIIIYDQLGKEVKRLVEMEQQPGFYTVTLSSHNLASGVYYYQLRTGAYIDTKKMVIIR